MGDKWCGHEIGYDDPVYFSMLASGSSVWIDDRYKFISSTGTVQPNIVPDPDIRVYSCVNCSALLLVSLKGVTTLSLVCPQCGSPKMKREE